MKAKAPEKIYIQRFDVDEEKAKFDKSKLFFDDVWTEEPEPVLENPKTENIEYTRTDAFIEKACEWLNDNASNYVFIDIDKIGNVADINLSLLVQDFKNYMKGE